MIKYKFTNANTPLEAIKISDCAIGNVISLEQGFFRICLLTKKSCDQYILGKEWIDADGLCHPSGVCFCDADESVMRVSAECYKATLA